MQITVIEHPLAISRLTRLRDKRTSNSSFRAALSDLGSMLIYEASRDLETETFDCETPVGTATGVRLKQPPIIVPIIRAGLGLVDPSLAMIPDAQVGFIGLARDEETHEPVPYLEALPENLSGQPVFLVDPMLATGGSLVHAIELLTARGADDITVVRSAQYSPVAALLWTPLRGCASLAGETIYRCFRGWKRTVGGCHERINRPVRGASQRARKF